MPNKALQRGGLPVKHDVRCQPATEMHLVVFDIDGTLVDSSEYESELYAQAIRDTLRVQVDEDWSQYRHVTDSGILEQVIENNNLSGDHGEIHERVKKRFIESTKKHFSNHPNSLREIPGAKTLIDRLKSKSSCILAIATGGWEETARLKLRGIGVELDGLALATGSDANSRVEIMQIAEARALDDSTAQMKSYFGDRVWDKQASESLGYDFIAVGNAVEHQPRFRDLLSHESILRQLGI